MATRSLVALAGCADGLTGGDGDAVGSVEYPDRPPELDEETVGPYVGDYEEAYQHNAVVEEGTEERQAIGGGAGVVSVAPRDGDRTAGGHAPSDG